MIEELYTDVEKGEMTTTKAGRIFSLRSQEPCPVDIHKVLAELEELVKNNQDQVLLSKKLRAIFPSLKKNKGSF